MRRGAPPTAPTPMPDAAHRPAGPGRPVAPRSTSRSSTSPPHRRCGSCAVCCGIASSAARSSTTSRVRRARVEPPAFAGHLGGDARRRRGAVDLEVVRPVAAGAAAWQQQGGLAGEAAEGLARRDDRDEQRASTDQCQGSAAADRRWPTGWRPPARRVRTARAWCRFGWCATRLASTSTARPADHRGILSAMCNQEPGDEDPGAEVVGGVEAESEDVVVLDVQHTGDDLEQDPADQHQQRQPLQHLRDRPRRRPDEQPRDHRPQLGQHDGDDDSPSPTCRPWVSRYSHDGRSASRTSAAAASRRRRGWPGRTAAVGDVGQQAGDDDDGQRHQQNRAEHRGQPGPRSGLRHWTARL